jgi:DUF971 family protein
MARYRQSTPFCYHLIFTKNDIFMSGLTPNSPHPIDIKLHQASRLLEIRFDNNTECMLSCEFLRVYSPSAEVKGHGPGQEVLQIGKQDVNITAIEPVGNYAIKLVFSDGHDTGLYSWDYLYDLASNYEALWLEYLGKLSASGHVRKNTA